MKYVQTIKIPLREPHTFAKVMVSSHGLTDGQIIGDYDISWIWHELEGRSGPYSRPSKPQLAFSMFHIVAEFCESTRGNEYPVSLVSVTIHNNVEDETVTVVP